MKSIVLILIGLSLVFAHHSHQGEHEPFVTREYLENLRETASFEVSDFQSHPFKSWSISDFRTKLGLMRREETVKREIFYGDSSDLPEEFDGRVQWPECVHKIRDQQSCGSCWAFAASEVLSDRFCIASNSKVNVVLSPQDMVSCDQEDFGCEGGYLDKSWDYLRDTGIVSDECLPYTSGSGDSGTCPFSMNKNQCKNKKVEYKKYRVSEHAQYLTIADAKKSLMTEGPIEAGFDVYSDFMNYRSGVYKHKSGGMLGGHAVKIVGWGKEKSGTEYWIVANSWNTSWGEKGFFNIAFGECNFESELFAGTPALDNLSFLQ